MKKENLIICAKSVIAYAQIANLCLHYKAKNTDSKKSVICFALVNAALAGVAGGIIEKLNEKEKNYEH